MTRPSFSRLFALMGLWVLFGMSLPAMDPPQPAYPRFTATYELEGENEEAVIHKAKLRAVKTCVGRIYFADYMLRARSLLDPYIEQYLDRFVAQLRVRESGIKAGSWKMKLDVVVDCVKLYEDLHEKRFIYIPAYRPLFYVFMAETFDGQNVEDRAGRDYLLEKINEEKVGEDNELIKPAYRYLWLDEPARADNPMIPAAEKQEYVMEVISPYQNPLAGPEALAAACREAERNEVEVFLAGKLETITEEKKEVYFDNYTYVKTTCELALVRADTGEVLASERNAVSAAHLDPEEARRRASRAAIDKTVPSLFAWFDANWRNMILREGKLRVMVLSPQEEDFGVVSNILMGLGEDVRIYTRSLYGQVAVYNVDWEGSTKDLIERVRVTRFPRFHMVFVKPDGIILQKL